MNKSPDIDVHIEKKYFPLSNITLPEYESNDRTDANTTQKSKDLQEDEILTRYNTVAYMKFKKCPWNNQCKRKFRHRQRLVSGLLTDITVGREFIFAYTRNRMGKFLKKGFKPGNSFEN